MTRHDKQKEEATYLYNHVSSSGHSDSTKANSGNLYCPIRAKQTHSRIKSAIKTKISFFFIFQTSGEYKY